MKQLKIVYMTVGGLLMLTSAIAFIYFTLFRYNATGSQWWSAVILGGLSGLFLVVGHELG